MDIINLDMFFVVASLTVILYTLYMSNSHRKKENLFVLVPVRPITIEKDKPKSISEILEEYIKDSDYEMIESKNLFETFKKCTEVINKNLKRIHGPEFIIVLSQNDVKASADEYLKKVSLSRIQCNSTKDIMQWYTLYITNIDRDYIEMLCLKIDIVNRQKIISSHLKLHTDKIIKPKKLQNSNISYQILEYNNDARFLDILTQEGSKTDFILFVYINLSYIVSQCTSMTMIQQIYSFTKMMDEEAMIDRIFNVASILSRFKRGYAIRFGIEYIDECIKNVLDELIANTGLTQQKHVRYLRYNMDVLFKQVCLLINDISLKITDATKQKKDLNKKRFEKDLSKYNQAIKGAMEPIYRYVKNNTETQIEIYSSAQSAANHEDDALMSIIDAIEDQINYPAKTKESDNIQNNQSSDTDSQNAAEDLIDDFTKDCKGLQAHRSGFTEVVETEIMSDDKYMVASDTVLMLLTSEYVGRLF